MPHDALLEELLHSKQLVLLALEHLRDWDAGPLRDDLGDLLVGDLVAQQLVAAVVLGLERLLEPSLELGNLAVLELGHAAEIGRAPRLLELRFRALELLFDLRLALHGGLLRLPDLLEVRELALELLDLLLEVGEPALRRVVGLLL